MATNIKAKKKKGSYDNKLIKWIAIGLAAVVALVVILAIVLTVSGNYVAKVNGKKIYNYEYKYFLMQAINEEYDENFEEFKPEGYDDMTDAQKTEVQKEFFSADRMAKIEEDALEDARLFKAEYVVALGKGYKATAEQKKSLDSYIDSIVSYYGSANAAALITSGTMTLKQYKKFYAQQITIANYKNAIKEGIEVSDADIREAYDKEPDEYRKITARLFQFKLPTAPKDDDGNVITEEKYNSEGIAAKDKIEYETYKKQIENYLALANMMKEAYDASADATFTLYDYDMTTLTPKKENDDDGNPTDKDAIKAENATFELLCTSQSSYTSASTNKGIITVNHDNGSGIKDVDDLVLTVQWNEARNGFVFVESANTDESSASSSSEAGDTVTTGATEETTGTATETEADKATPSEIKIVEVRDDNGHLTALYLVRVEDINDIDTKADADAEDGLNTVQATIKANILEERAVDQLEKEVADGGSKYELKSKKTKTITTINNEQWEYYGFK